MKEQSFHITWILDLVQPYKAVRTVISPLQKSKKGIKETSLIKNNLTVQWKKPRRQGEFKVLRIDWHQQGRPVSLEFLPVPVHTKRHLAESKARNLQHKHSLSTISQSNQTVRPHEQQKREKEKEKDRQTCSNWKNGKERWRWFFLSEDLCWAASSSFSSSSVGKDSILVPWPFPSFISPSVRIYLFLSSHPNIGFSRHPLFFVSFF